MDDPGRQAVHDAIQEWCAREGEVVTHWYLTADVQGQNGDHFTAHRSGTLAGDHPSRTEIIGMLGMSLAVEIADTIVANRRAADDED
jgi:hypothetical protein